MTKKKKQQLKPVARGFNTISVAKKPQPVEELPVLESALPQDDRPSKNSELEDSLPNFNSPKGDARQTSFESRANDFDPDQVEEQSLQNLVDKYQEKTDREVSRTVKNIETDRRLSVVLPQLCLDQAIEDRIFATILRQNSFSNVKLGMEPEEKLVSRLAITFGVLKKLGFTKERVEECLGAINGVELDEAYDWLYLHCSEDELAGEQGKIEMARRSGFRRSPEPEQLQIAQGYERHELLETTSEDGFTSLVSTNPNFPSIEDDTSTTEDPHVVYAHLKLQVAQLNRRPKEQIDTSLLQRLQARLKLIQASYYFSQEEGDKLYRTEQKKFDEEMLLMKLRGQNQASAEPLPTSKKVNEKPGSPSNETDIFEEDDGDSGGMFDLLESMPPTIFDGDGTTVTVREMALPKNWSGRTPRTLLKEAVTRIDRFAVVVYTSLSGASRAKRAMVSVRWEGNRTQDWKMIDVACHDEPQAEQYISTIALHALVFPSTEGFASASSILGNYTSFRLLPPKFRDLWDELEFNRRSNEDRMNRATWSRLRGIVEKKMCDHEPTAPVAQTQGQETYQGRPPTEFSQNARSISERIIADFDTRRASSAYQEMLSQRNQLPIANYRSRIISALECSQVLILSGETGCGKSTQLPSFILEDQLSRGQSCRILCTEPRRISAISLAQRVSRELGDDPGAVGTSRSLVGYSIRLESSVSKNTRLTFVTNGIALRMLESGSGHGGKGTAFDEVTHLIVDEVHERSIESDFLLIVLKSLILQRPSLKVVLMSATVDAEKLSNYFSGCPTLHVPGRTFPVKTYYLEDALEYTKWAIEEGSPYARRAHDKFYRNRTDWSEETAGEDEEDEDNEPTQSPIKIDKRYTPSTIATINLLDERVIPYELIVRLLERTCFEDESYAPYSAAILIFMPGLGEIRRMNDLLSEHQTFGNPSDFLLYPLHSTISSDNQSAVFDIPPPGVRKIVIATNIAETGITIPDITLVIDTGKHREMRFDEKRQLSRLIETFIAKSNAAQRRGRAGRVRKGLCFHLFTKLRHDSQMADHPSPEMMRLSLSDLALRIKIMKVKLGTSIEDVLSQALDPPTPINVQRAVAALIEVRALTSLEEITPMGRLLSKLPTDVHLGKFLLIAALFRCLDPALTIAATLNSKSPFVTPFGLKEQADRAKNSFRVENSDFLTIHNAFASWRRACGNPEQVRKFCKTNFLSHQNLQQIEELRQQFLGYLIDSSFIHVDSTFVRELSRARYGRGRTRFVHVPLDLDTNSSNPNLINAALAAGLYPKVLSVEKNGVMKTITNSQQVAFHPSSVNFKKNPTDFGVRHLAYFTLMQSKRLYVWETGPVDDLALVMLCGDVDFKLTSNSLFIDRKIKMQLSPKTNIALKIIRQELASLLAQSFKGKPLTEQQQKWMQLSTDILGKVKIDGISAG